MITHCKWTWEGKISAKYETKTFARIASSCHLVSRQINLLQWFDLGWTPGTNQTNRTEGDKYNKRLMGQDKDEGITQQLPCHKLACFILEGN